MAVDLLRVVPTGFNPGLGASPFGNGVASPPPRPQSGTVDTTPANVFAKMKSGAFASDSGTGPQAAGTSPEQSYCISVNADADFSL